MVEPRSHRQSTPPGWLRRFLFGSLRRQLILGIVAANALIMILFVADLVGRQREFLMERQTEHAIALARGVATTSAGWLGAQDFNGLREIVDSQRRYPELHFAMVLDMRGHIVAHTDAERLNQYVTDLPAPDAAENESSVHVLHRSAAEVDVLCPIVLAGYQIGWVRVGLGQERAAEQLVAISRNGAIYTLVAILVGSTLAALLGRWLTRRLHRIQQVADAVQQGDYSRRAGIGGVDDEAARLAAAFDAMLDTLAAREEALRESEGRFGALIETSFLPMLVTGALPESKVLMMNRRFTEVFGYTLAEVRDLAAWWPLAYPDADYRREIQDRWQAAVAVMLARGSPHIEPVAAEITCRDGDRRFVEIHMTVYQGRALVLFNDLTERRNGERELEQHRQHLEDLVATRTAELERAKDAAETANRAKSVFLANMSHELRTPLNAILGFAQIMRRDPTLGTTHHRELDTINRSGRHLLALINDVLEISRIEAGRTAVRNAVFDLPGTIAMVEDMIDVRAEAKGLRLVVEGVADCPAHVLGDAPHLRQVLINLLGNAVKFTDQGTVSLRLHPQDDGIRFEVADTGPGIATTDQERIFQAFFQADAGMSTGEGTGLGLTISRNFVRLMGGELTVTSEPGRGSVFSFTLPLPAASAPAADPRGRIVGLDGGGATYRVLVVEDHADSRELLARWLDGAGFQVMTADNGQQAVDVFQHWRPHFIWMDMRMPVMDGYAATRAIRALRGGDAAKIVALTASAFREDRDAILAAGCDEMVSKPLEEGQLFETMGRLLGLRYRYADAIADEAPPPMCAEAALAALPEALRAELAVAARVLDVEAIGALIERLRPAHADAARVLGELVSAYRFDVIADLLGELPRASQ